jgi:hypothetical protein
MRAAGVVLAALLTGACAAPIPRGVADKDVRDAAQALDATVRRILASDGVARNDGFLYGLDVAGLLLYAARGGDRALYDTVRPYADRVIVTQSGDPYTRGFVLWRQRPGVDFEIAGAGESIAMARALLAGAASFGYASDRDLAHQVLEGYGKLAFEKGMTWSVRRYFNFATRSYSDASLLSGYAPDFLAEAGALSPAKWPAPVERSYAAIELASTDRGLVRPVMLPELNETWSDLTQRAFAPDNIAPLEDSCVAAEAAVRGRPQIARNLLDFALDSKHTNFLGRLFAYFDVATGKPVGEALLTPIGYACLMRVAVALGDDRAVAELGSWFTRDLELIAGEPNVHPAPLYAAAPLLLAAQALKALPSRSESAAVQTPNVAGQGRRRGENP